MERQTVGATVGAFVLAMAMVGGAAAQDRTPVNVLIANDDNLQWMNYWVAEGAGYFVDEGLDVRLVVEQGGRPLLQGSADLAVMARPQFLSLVAMQRPVVAVANLLANDGINVVVHQHIADERGLSIDLPLEERVQGLRGLRIGVAPGPPSRLAVLLASYGLDPDADVETVIIEGADQNRAFGDGEVDALYAHTPFLETALLEQDGVLLVDQSSGEVKELADRQIHVLVTTRAYAGRAPEVVEAMTRAILRAQRLIHADSDATIEAIRASSAQLLAPDGLATIVDIYEPAIPRSPDVTVEGALRELALFPSTRPAPDISAADLEDHIDNRFAEAAVTALEAEGDAAAAGS